MSDSNNNLGDGSGGGFLGKIRGVFAKKGDDSIYANDFKNEKEVALRYQTAAKEEREKRKQPDDPPLPEKAETPLDHIPAASKSEQVKTDKEKQLVLEDEAPAAGKKSAKDELLGRFNQIKQWQHPQTVKTNLIRGESTTFVDWGEKIKVLIVGLSVPILIVAVLYIGLMVWETQSKKKVQALGGEITDLQTRIKTAEQAAKPIDEFQAKVKLVGKLLDEHIYWTNLFAFLEKNILSNATLLGGLSGDAENYKYSLSLKAEHFVDIPNQVRVLRENPLVKSAEVFQGSAGTVFGENGDPSSVLNFNLLLELDPSILTKDQ